MTEVLDAVVIGAGPGGLAATLGLARMRRTVMLLDSNRPRHAATLVSHGYLTRDGISPLELRKLGREEVLAYPHVQYERTIVTSVSPLPDGNFIVVARKPGSQEQSEWHARTVLIATGQTETLPVQEHVRPWYGTSLHSCMDCDGYDKRGQALALIGETEDVADRALIVRQFSRDLKVFTNGSGAVSAEDNNQLARLGVEVYDSPIAGIEGGRDGMQAVLLEDGSRHERTAGFVRPEWHATLGFAESLGLEVDEHGLVEVDRKQRTSVLGVYAAGDITPGFRQLQVAAGQGTVAASVINRDLIGREL
ncbi:MAG: NAD(P)/FAD-dependent oxidoreductase [Agrococcus casei]|uniref:NAD(P)/FAD-dependent oxidoreductase n=1 Tax=Agrococcus casei TaxID=343512 RepID=UPI003F9D7D41